MEVSGQLHTPAALPPGKEPWTGDWVGPTAVPDVVVKRKIPSACWDSLPSSNL